MDYTKAPRSLIYRERRSLEEFKAYEKESITRPLADAMLGFGFIQFSDSENRALWCLNTAFYICTMILMEVDPRWRLDDYKRIAYPKLGGPSQNFQYLTLSIVVLLLSRLENPLPLLSNQGKTRNHFISLMIGGESTNKIFQSLYDRINADPFIIPTIPNSTFAPRIIDKETVYDVMTETDYKWTLFTHYFEERSMRDIVKAFGTNEDEKHNVVDILRQASHGFYAAGFDRPKQVDVILANIDEEIRLHFNHETDKVITESEKEELQYQGDIRPLQARIAELEAQLSNAHWSDNTIPDNTESLNSQLSEAKKNIEGLDHTIEKKEEEINKLKRTIENLENDIEGYKDKEKGISAHLAALFSVAVCKRLGWNNTDRQKLWPFMNTLWGYSRTTSEKALRESYTQEEADNFADKFDSYTPNIAKLIRELPDKIKEEKEKKLLDINPSINKS